MTPTLTDPRAGETYALRRPLDRPDMLLSPCKRVHLCGNGYGFLTAELWLPDDTDPHPVVEFSVQVRGDIANPADVQSALWALEGAIAGRKLAEENKRLRAALEPFAVVGDLLRAHPWPTSDPRWHAIEKASDDTRRLLSTALTKEAPDVVD